MSETSMPLVDLFMRLRDADLPLGTSEYLAMLRALQLGFGTADRESLRRLCHSVWAKSSEEARLIDLWFDALHIGEMTSQHHHQDMEKARTPSPEPDPIDRSAPEAMKGPLPEKQDDLDVLVDGHMEKGSIDELSSEDWELDDNAPTQEGVDIGHVIQAALMAPEAPMRHFQYKGEYVPITSRQMKQSWRYLRWMVKEGVPTDLNVVETARSIEAQGFLLEPVLEPRRKNRAELVLAIDREGSMVPFHGLGQHLVDTAMRGGHLRRADAYYFHNCPQDYFYHDTALVDEEPLSTVLSFVSPEHTMLLVFSDAGAARGTLRPSRFQETNEFLMRSRSAFRRVAWLNPMPRSRWRHTTAAAIAELVPMFEAHRPGLDAAIESLRGRVDHMNRVPE